MALSFKEKREVQREVESCFAKLEANPDFKTKRTLQKQLEVAFAKLEGKIKAAVKTLYDRLVAGEFNSEPVQRFCEVLAQVYTEIGQKLEPLREPAKSYVKANEDKMVFESAYNSDFLLQEIRLMQTKLGRLTSMLTAG